MDDIYNSFIQNINSYDAKQVADTLNKLNSDEYKTLNFQGKDNTVGFKNWNLTFNESGLNNLFGFNDDKANYLGITTRSRKNFIDHLKEKNTIATGNGNLFWNSESNQWEYNDWVDKTTNDPGNSGNSDKNGNTASAPKISELELKKLNLKKPIDYNPDGIINSLAGYIVNEAANFEKNKVQKELPIYQEIMTLEKAFKTPYTYDLEKSKNEIMAEATNIQPITSDADVYYNAKNNAIKNARAYTTKLDTEINDIVHEIANTNQDIAFDNAVSRTNNANTNAKYRHDWEVEQKQGEVDHIEARNQSFQNLNKEIKHNVVTDARRKQKQRDAYMNKHILTGITTTPSNYIDGWTKHHDLIWYKGQNGKLETDQEQTEYQNLLSVVNQAASAIFAQYENIKYPGQDVLHTNSVLKESYTPDKHGYTVIGAKGMKIDLQKINNFINKLK